VRLAFVFAFTVTALVLTTTVVAQETAPQPGRSQARRARPRRPARRVDAGVLPAATPDASVSDAGAAARAAADGGAADASSDAAIASDAGSSDGGAPDASVADASVQLPPLTPFTDGTFDLVGAEAEDRAIDEAIDGAIRTLHPSLRDAFRAQLRSTLRLPRKIVVVRDATRARITWDETAIDAPLDGTESSVRGTEGRTVQLSVRDDHGGLILVQRTPNFTRTDRIGGEGHGIVVELSLRSRLLPRPIEVSATYSRHAP